MEENQKFHNLVKKVLQDNGLFVSQESLYHFTNINGLLGIITNNELWLSERNYLNDVNDEKFIKDYVRNIFKNLSQKEWEEYEIYLIPSKNQYIFSTSKEKDSIHQWTYYGLQESFCIEFERKKLINLFYRFDKKTDFYYGPILYGNERTLNIANKIIDEYTSLISNKNCIFNIDNFDEKGFSEFKRVYQYFYSLIKQTGHSCENEYRFLLQSESKPEFRISNGLFVPFIKVKAKGKLPIKKIYIGPNSYETSAKENLEYFLKNNGYNNVIVDKSEMHIRR